MGFREGGEWVLGEAFSGEWEGMVCTEGCGLREGSILRGSVLSRLAGSRVCNKGSSLKG